MQKDINRRIDGADWASKGVRYRLCLGGAASNRNAGTTTGGPVMSGHDGGPAVAFPLGTVVRYWGTDLGDHACLPEVQSGKKNHEAGRLGQLQLEAR